MSFSGKKSTFTVLNISIFFFTPAASLKLSKLSFKNNLQKKKKETLPTFQSSLKSSNESYQQENIFLVVFTGHRFGKK